MANWSNHLEWVVFRSAMELESWCTAGIRLEYGDGEDIFIGGITGTGRKHSTFEAAGGGILAF